jgi:hypothetical protein
LYARAVNLLRAQAKRIRAKGQPKKSKKVQAWVGKKRSKANEIKISSDQFDLAHGD